MVKSFVAKDHVTLRGVLLLLFGSILFGVIAGAIAYVISLFFYLFIVFPVLISSFCVKGFEKLFYYSKIQNKFITVLSAILVGCSISAVFTAIPYIRDRNQVIDEIAENYSVDQDRAAAAVDQALYDETGQHGYLAYQILNAREGVVYTNYFMVNSIVIFNFDFTLRGFLFWFFFITQIFLFGSLLLLRAFSLHSEPFNFRANDFYNMTINCIGAVQSTEKTAFFELLNSDHLEDARRLIVPEMDLSHPKIEVYENFPKKPNGDSILTIKQTYFDQTKKIKRKVLALYEVVLPESPFANQAE